jgi:hypothetical protein
VAIVYNERNFISDVIASTSDPEGDPVRWYEFRDTDPAVGTNYFWIYDGTPATGVLLGQAGDYVIFQGGIYGGNPTPGASETFYVRASDGGAYGAWTPFQVTTLATPADSAGQTYASARVLNLSSNPQTVTEWIGQTDASDYYKFSLPSAKTVQVDISDPSNHTKFEILDTVNFNSVNGGFGNGSFSGSVQLAAGDYYLLMTPQNTQYGQLSADYQVTLAAT